MADKKTVAITISANTRRLKADMRRATNEVRAFERQVGGVANRMKRMRMNFMQSGIFGRGGGALRTAAGFAGVFGFQQMIMDAKNLDAALTDVAVTGGLGAGKLAQLKKQMFDVSSATGKSTKEVLSFVQAVTTATGDTGSAMVALKGMGEVAVATGADMSDLGKVFVSMTTNMKILPENARKAFNILRSQEKKGAVTLSQMATVLPDIIGAGAGLGRSATGLGGLSGIGALMQITRRGANVSESKTSVMRFLQKLGTKGVQKKLKKLGINVLGASGEARSIEDISRDIATVFAKGNTLGVHGKIFGDRAIKTVAQLALVGRAGWGKNIGTLQSAKSIFGAGGTDEIGADFKRVTQSASFQFGKVMNDLRNTLQKFAIPVFTELAKSLKEFGPDMVKALKFILENSRSLLKLWLGWKGAQFFRNLMKAGNMGSSEAGAIAGGAGFMTNSGVVSPTRNIGGGFTQYASPIGPQMPMTRRQRAGAFMSRYGGTMARGGGFALGMASPMLFKGSNRVDMFQGQDMAENMALMSGNPYLMAMGGMMKANAHMRANDMSIGDKLFTGGGTAKRVGLGVATLGASEVYRYFNKPQVAVGDAIGTARTATIAAQIAASISSSLERIASKQGEWRRSTPEGVKHERAKALMGMQLGAGTGKDTILNPLQIAGGGVALRNRLQAITGVERQLAIQRVRAKGGDVTDEAQLRKENPEYARFSEYLKESNSILAQLAAGKIVVNAAVKIDTDGIAKRLDMIRAWGPQGNTGHPTGRGEGRGAK